MKEWQNKLTEYVKEQNIEEIKKIIKENKNENFGFTDKSGKTLLHFLVEKKNEKTLPLLQIFLKLGVDANSVDENFESPLEIAKKNNNIPALATLKHYINFYNKEMQDLI